MTKNYFLSFVFFIFAGILGCSSSKCQKEKEPNATENAQRAEAGAFMKKSVKVYKADGSLQCGQGSEISLEKMSKDLGDIKVLSSFKKNDGLMRMQVCGAPTGNCNVFEISETDLAAALKKGFKEWSF